MFADERHQIATRIAQKLRDADVGCELVEFLPTEAAVVRRDRLVVVLALILLRRWPGATCYGSRPTWACAAWT